MGSRVDGGEVETRKERLIGGGCMVVVESGRYEGR